MSLQDMIQPTTAMQANLRATTTGVVWADYQLFGSHYRYCSDDAKVDTLVYHQDLLRMLPNGSLILGAVAPLDPQRVADRIAHGVDLDRNRAWRVECDSQREVMRQRRPTERIFAVSIPLADPFMPAGSGGGVRAARGSEGLALAGAAPEAAAIAAKLPAVFDARPLSVNQMVWLWNRAVTRGSYGQGYFPEPVESNVSAKTGALRQAVLREHFTGKAPGRRDRFASSRIVQITQPGRRGAEESWQMLMVVESFPIEGLSFPGSEFFALADRVSGFEIDWAVRVRKRSAAEVVARNNKLLARVKEQVDERDLEVSFAQNTLAHKVRELGEYTDLMESRDGEMEIEFCAIFAVAATTRGECERGADLLAKELGKRASITLASPLGGQRELWASMNPGCPPTSRAVADFGQITISEYAAASIPIQASTIGDDTGPLIGMAGRRPVHLDLFHETSRDGSASIGMAGELGAGKSYLLKTVFFQVTDLGGQFMVIDRTRVGEYVPVADAIDGAVVVDMLEPKVSMDPLRVFPAGIGADAALSMLLPLFGVSTDDPMARALSDMLEPQYRREHGINSLGGLRTHLQTLVVSNSAPTAVVELEQTMRYWAARSYTAALFRDGLPALDLDAPGIVVRTNRLDVPTTEEVFQPHLFERMSPEKKFGRAVYGLTAAMAAHAFFANVSRFSIFGLDEAYHLTSTAEGEGIAAKFIRDGRRHNTAVALGSHDPATDYGQGAATGLIPYRFLFRHRDERLARNGLTWLGIDPDAHPHVLRDLMKNTSPKGPDKKVPLERRGECYMRDARGLIDRVKILGPPSAQRAAAINTTPESQAAA